MEQQNHLRLFVSYGKKDKLLLKSKKLRLLKVREATFNLHLREPHLEFHEAEVFERGLSFQSRCVDFDEVVEMAIRGGEVGLLRYGRQLAPTIRDSKWSQLGLDEQLEVRFSNEQVVQFALPGQSLAQVRANRDRLIQRAFELKVLCDEDTGAVLTDKERIQLNLKDWNYEVMRHAMYHRKLHMDYLEFQATSDLQAALPQMRWWLNFSWERQIWTFENIFAPCLKAYTDNHSKPPSQEILKYFGYVEKMKSELANPTIESFAQFNDIYLQIPAVASLDCFRLYEHFDHSNFMWLPRNSLEVTLSNLFNADKFDDLRFAFKLKINQKQQRITSFEGNTSLVFPTYNEVKAFFHQGRSNMLIYSPQIPNRDLTYFTYWQENKDTDRDSLDLISKEAMTKANEGHKLLRVSSNSDFVYLFTAKQRPEENGKKSKSIVISRYPRSENWTTAVHQSSSVLTLRTEDGEVKPHFCFGLNRNRPWVAMSLTEEADNGDKSHLLVVSLPEAKKAHQVDLTGLLRDSSLATKSTKRYSKILDASVQIEGYPILLVHDVGVSQKSSHARIVQLKAYDSLINRQLDLDVPSEDLSSHKVEFIPAKSSVIVLEVLLKTFEYRVTVVGKTAINRLTQHFRFAAVVPRTVKSFVWLRREKVLVVLAQGNCYFNDQQVAHFRLKC